MTGTTSWVAGVDGCRGGWLVVMHPVGQRTSARVLIVRQFADVLRLDEKPILIAVDIPIGLPERSGPGGRACDSAARATLGARRSSVFAVPARAAISETDYRRACDVAVQHSDPPRKVAKQTFNLFAKIREVDAVMTPALQTRVVECHPERVFWRLNGERPLHLPKKFKSRPHEPGLDLRRGLLVASGYPDDALRRVPFPRSEAGADDVLDAFANTAAANDMLEGRAICVPGDPPRDGKGLRMEIWG